MKLRLYVTYLAFAVGSVSAFRAPLKQVRRPSPQNAKRSGSGAISGTRLLAAAASDNDQPSSIDLTTVHDLIYMADVTIGGENFTVQLDTGSSDLWVQTSSSSLSGVNQTNTAFNLTYGIGWAYGHLAYGPTEFAGVSVSDQAFLSVSSANNPALGYGAEGIVGLGFDGLSNLDALVNASGASTGRSLLYNAFQNDPSEPNFIAFALERSTDPDGTEVVEGTFTIGEYDDQYKDVASNPPLSTFPVSSPKRWTVLLDAVIMGETAITVSTTVGGAPSNRAVALLDSGTSFTYAPTDIVKQIYGNIEGASFDSTEGLWSIPCDTEIDMALQFGGIVYPLHPLDVVPESVGSNNSCVGSFVPGGVAVGAGEFDWLVGDSVLRSVYSVYDFGDFDSSGKMGDPYIKLLSLIDPDDASKDFAAERGTKARTGITYKSVNSTANASSSSSVTISNDVANTLDKLGKYLPIMAGIMALNAIVLLVLMVVGIWLLCRKRKSGKVSRFAKKRDVPGRMSPMPMNPTSSHPDAFTPPAHSYEPVSMAMTEDTVFAPPSPSYGDTMKGFPRPKSYAPSERPYSQAESTMRPYSMAGGAGQMSPSKSAPSNPFAAGGVQSPRTPPTAATARTSPLAEQTASVYGEQGMPHSGSQTTLNNSFDGNPKAGMAASSSTSTLLRPSHSRGNMSVSSEFAPPMPAFHNPAERPKSFA